MTTAMMQDMRFVFGPEIDKLAAALVQFQKDARPVLKGSTAKVEKDGRTLYTYDYADFADVVEATREARAAAGLAVVQMPTGDGNGITVVTTVIHASGQWMRGELTMKPLDSKPQTIGSLISYVRRYCYAGALGIVTDKDDDGSRASGVDGSQGGKKPPVAGNAQRANKVPAQGSKASAAQVQQIHILKEKIGGWTGKADHDKHPYRAALLAYKDSAGKPVTTSKDLTLEQASNLITRMQGMIDRQAQNAARGLDVVSEAMNDNRELGSDDGDDGEAPNPGLLEDVRSAVVDRWGKHAETECPPWLQEHFGVLKTSQLSKLQAQKALQLLLAQ